MSRKVTLDENYQAMVTRLDMVLKGISTRAELARNIGISSTNISRYLNGAVQIPVDVLLALISCSKCNANWILFGQGDISLKSKNSITIADFKTEVIEQELTRRKDFAKTFAEQYINIINKETLQLACDGKVQLTIKGNKVSTSGPIHQLGQLGILSAGDQPLKYTVYDAEQLTTETAAACYPVLGRIAAGSGIDTVEAENYPAGMADTFISCLGDRLPHGFACVVKGKSMLPTYKPGDYIIVDGAQPVTSGVCCVIERVDGLRTVKIKNLELSGKKAVLKSINPDFPPREVSAKKIEAYKIVTHIATDDIVG